VPVIGKLALFVALLTLGGCAQTETFKFPSGKVCQLTMCPAPLLPAVTAACREPKSGEAASPLRFPLNCFKRPKLIDKEPTASSAAFGYCASIIGRQSKSKSAYALLPRVKKLYNM
jgi:hypothetical protein